MKNLIKPDINPSETQSKPNRNLGVQSEKTCRNLAVITLLKNLTVLIFVWLLAVLVVASCSNNAYAKDLSESKSVTPQRHCGFIVLKLCKAPQSLHLYGASVTATQTRLKSVYDWMTPQNKAMPNMWGASFTARVNPVALILQVSVILNSKVKGGNHHA